jgi:outer membrane protein assembly factor BamB
MFGGCDALLHVIDITKGEREKVINANSYIIGSVSADAGRVYVGHHDNEFLCIDLKAGKIIWNYKDRLFPYSSSPALTKDRVLFGGQDKRLHCLRRDNGEAIWTFATRGQVNSSPVVCDGKVLVGSNDGRLYMVSLDQGKSLWSYETDDSITASPAVAGGKVVIGSEDGTVYCFGAKAK